MAKPTKPQKPFQNPKPAAPAALEVYGRAQSEGAATSRPGDSADLGEQLAAAAKLIDELKRLKLEAQNGAAKAALDLKDAERRQQAAAEEMAKLAQNRRDLAGLEKKLLDERSELTLLRAKADDGFLDERRRLLGTVENQLEQLRQERTKLLHETDALRASGVASLTAELDALRRERIAALTSELAADRAAHDAALERETAVREGELNRTERRLADERRRLDDQQRELRAEKAELDTARAIHDEDVQNLEAKVERVAKARVVELESELESRRLEFATTKRRCERLDAELHKHRELERQLNGRSATALIEELNQLRDLSESLESELRTRPTTAMVERLRELEAASESWADEQARLEQKLGAEQTRSRKLEVGAASAQMLQKLNEINEIRIKQQEHAIDQLRAETDQLVEVSASQSPFKALQDLDDTAELQRAPRTVDPVQGDLARLPSFVTTLRHRMAVALGGAEEGTPRLDYAEADLRSWLGGMAMSRLILLQGISGTGKTSLPRAFAGAIGSTARVVPVQAAWRDRQDLVGYYNAFQKRYYATEFLKALYEAGTPAHRDRPYFIVLDEMNLSRVEQFFADFLSALELQPSERRLTLVDASLGNAPKLLVEGRHLCIPQNVWFVGTANHDETTNGFADKTIDRSHVMELPRRASAPGRVSDLSLVGASPGPVSFEKLDALFRQSARHHAGEAERAIEWLGRGKVAAHLAAELRIGWGNRLEDQARRFVPVVMAAGGTLGEAVDHLLASRILRKVQDRYDVREPQLDALKAVIAAEWPLLDRTTPASKSMALIDRERKQKQSEGR